MPEMKSKSSKPCKSSESLHFKANMKIGRKSKIKARREERRDKSGRKKRSGSRIPAALHLEIDELDREYSEEPADDVVNGDVYEYEEEIPQEESGKNRRFDPVENYEPDLPSDFEDEEIQSDGDEEDGDGLEEVDEDEEGNEEKHQRLLQAITGLPGQAFSGDMWKKVDYSDAQGEAGDAKKISIEDLLEPLHGKPGYSDVRKRLHHLEKNSMALLPPLPTVEMERIERKVAYEHSKKDITKWEPLVKRNREAPTLFFEEDEDIGYSTVGAIANGFRPNSDFEKQMAMLVRDPEVIEAHSKDGAKLLELEVPAEDVKERQHRLAKMKELLFRHEMKLKRIKNIKSKTFRRLLKKDRLKAESTLQMDPDIAKEYALKQERKRAEERMTLKHKNCSRWAKRILKRGLQVQDESTRVAITEQLNQHALLTRKMNSMRDTSSSDDTSDDGEDEESIASENEKEGASKLLCRAKEKTLKLFEEEDNIPKSGILGLPFMQRSLKKQKDGAYDEACLAVQEYDSSLRSLEDGIEQPETTGQKASGRKIFGPARKQQSQESTRRTKSENAGSNSDREEEFKENGNVGFESEANDGPQKEIYTGTALLNNELGIEREPLFKSIDDIVKDPGSKTSYEVAIFASDKWRKMKSEISEVRTAHKSQKGESEVRFIHDVKVPGQQSDSESDDEMVDGDINISQDPDHEILSRDSLIRHAFAGDDVEAEFDKDKMEVLDEENPEPEKPVLLPGWGQWTDIQQKRGMPSWMLREHENAKREREEALKKRKDAYLKHVIISESIDRKAEKLQTRSLPYPYKSKEVFEQSIRMPIGPEYNPAVSVRDLNRPEVIKKAGIIIKPIKFEEVDPHEKSDEPKRIVQNVNKKRKSAEEKPTKKATTKKR